MENKIKVHSSLVTGSVFISDIWLFNMIRSNHLTFRNEESINKNCCYIGEGSIKSIIDYLHEIPSPTKRDIEMMDLATEIYYLFVNVGFTDIFLYFTENEDSYK